MICIKLNETNTNCNLRNLETDQALPRAGANFLKLSFTYSGAMLSNDLFHEAIAAQSLSEFKRNLASLPLAGSR